MLSLPYAEGKRGVVKTRASFRYREVWECVYGPGLNASRVDMPAL